MFLQEIKMVFYSFREGFVLKRTNPFFVVNARQFHRGVGKNGQNLTDDLSAFTDTFTNVNEISQHPDSLTLILIPL